MAQRYIPSQLVEQGVWKDEPYAYTTGGSSSNVLKDSVYVDSEKPDEPFYISSIQSFKMIRRGEQLSVVLKWFYRRTEVPEILYNSLNEDRNDSSVVDDEFGKIIHYDEQARKIRQREIFISDAVDSRSISVLRGKCFIRNFKDLSAARRQFQLVSDSFFYILGYNPQNQTLASIQGEIRVGPNHQAKIPELLQSATAITVTISTPDCESSSSGDDNFEEHDARILEEPEWILNDVSDSDLTSYLNAVRTCLSTRRLFSTGKVDYSVGTEVEPLERTFQDLTVPIALKTLHQCSYDSRRAFQQITDDPLPVTIEQKWSEEDTKKFVKGIRQFNKNFHQIRTQLLPEKKTGELVEFYYLWKKTVGANGARRRLTRRPQADKIIKRIKAGQNNQSKNNVSTIPPNTNQFEDHNSASESELQSDNSDSNKWSSYACHHCYSSSSKDWHHATKDRILLCFNCREHYHKYHSLPPFDSSKPDPSSHMIKSSMASNGDDGDKEMPQDSPKSPAIECHQDNNDENSDSGAKRKLNDINQNEQIGVIKRNKHYNSVSLHSECSNHDDIVTVPLSLTQVATASTTATVITSTVSMVDYAVSTTTSETAPDQSRKLSNGSKSTTTMSDDETESTVDDESSNATTGISDTIDETSLEPLPRSYETIWESGDSPFYKLVRISIPIGRSKCFRTQTEWQMTDQHPKMIERRIQKQKEQKQEEQKLKEQQQKELTVKQNNGDKKNHSAPCTIPLPPMRGYPGVTLPTALGRPYVNDMTSQFRLGCLYGQYGPTEQQREYRSMMEHPQLIQPFAAGGEILSGLNAVDLAHLLDQQQQQASFSHRPTNGFTAPGPDHRFAGMPAASASTGQHVEFLDDHHHVHHHHYSNHQQQQANNNFLALIAMQQATMRLPYNRQPITSQIQPQMGMVDSADIQHAHQMMQLRAEVERLNRAAGMFDPRLQ